MERTLYYRLVQVAIQTLVIFDEPVPYNILVSGRAMLFVLYSCYSELVEEYPHLQEQADFIADTVSDFRTGAIDYKTACQRLHEAVLNYEANRSGG